MHLRCQKRYKFSVWQTMKAEPYLGTKVNNIREPLEEEVWVLHPSSLLNISLHASRLGSKSDQRTDTALFYCSLSFYGIC